MVDNTAAYEQITVAHDGATATITMTRPDALNAITPTMLAELNHAMAAADADEEITVAVLTGEGRAFSAGVDLLALGDRSLEGGSVGDILDIPARELTSRLADGRLVTIAQVNGFCFTGALELALACDIMVAANEAKMADTHAKFGLRPTWGMSARLPAAVGMIRARELSYTARTFSGAEAAAMGMAATAVPLTELDETVRGIAAAVAANSTGSLAAYKDLYAQPNGSTIADGLAHEEASSFEIADTEPRLASFRS